MEYEVKKGHYPKIEGDGLKDIMGMTFGGVKVEGNKLVSSYGAITKVEVKVLSKTALEVASETDKTRPLDVQADTIKRWNTFLEQATGFTSKERSKRLQKKAKEGKL
ncbi:MAG: DUF5611 family protein [Methanomassiliicoccales archaeon]|jgi:hypothetical protein|nr:DUF5611 family protein [Methanomassiliicoccales archaeon]MDD1755270.1 DUF5611 family protein [Methanomassiliicoccales archaeon]